MGPTLPGTAPGAEEPDGVSRLLGLLSEALPSCHSGAVPHQITARLPWDSLDAQSLGPDAVPEWTTLIVTGPMTRTDRYGRTTLHWTATVECRLGPRP